MLCRLVEPESQETQGSFPMSQQPATRGSNSAVFTHKCPTSEASFTGHLVLPANHQISGSPRHSRLLTVF